MRFFVYVVLVQFAVVVQCNEFSLLHDLNSIDFSQIFDKILTTNLNDFEEVSRSRLTSDDILREREYDQNKCVIELGTIADGLNGTEMWAMKLIDSWGKIPSGILEGNIHALGSFSECLDLERNEQKYESQYCLAEISLKIDGIFPPKQTKHTPEMELRMAMPAIGTDGIGFSLGTCFPQSCSPKAITELLHRIIPQNIQKKITVKIDEEWCQFQASPSNMREIDWIALGLLLTVLGLMIASTLYDIYCTLNEKSKIRIFMAFSVYTNGRSLLSCKKSKSKDVMDCIHGIRVFSTQWVVLGHTYFMYIAMPTTNILSFMTSFLKQYHSMYLMSGLISVDTFFMLSGLFASYTMLKHLEKTKGRINIPLLYFHRLLRLTPILAVSILLTVSLIRYAGSGPRWPIIINALSAQCEENWWKTLLYVQNYVSKENICFGHSWYLAVDMQLFLLSPFIVYGIYRFRVRFLYLLSVFVWLCVGCTIATYIELNYTATMMGQGMDFFQTYYPTHLRYSPWLVGMIFGAILHESRKSVVRIPRKVNLCAWLLTFTLMATVIFSSYPLWQPDHNTTALENGIYVSMSRVAWALALSYLIYACVHGYGGPVNWFLSLSFWQPLSRLSYAIYILHFPVVLVVMASAKTAREVNELLGYHAFLGNYVLAVLVSIIGSLAFESPIVCLEKILFGIGKKRDIREDVAPKPIAPPEEV